VHDPGCPHWATDMYRRYWTPSTAIPAVGMTVVSPGRFFRGTMDLASPSWSMAAESTDSPSVRSVSPERNSTFERHWFPGIEQSPIVSPKAMRTSGFSASPLSHVMPRSVPGTPQRLIDSLGLVGPVTSCSKRVGPSSTGTVPCSPVIHGGIPYTEPTSGSSEPEMPLPSDPVSSCWTSEPERSSEPSARDVEPTESEEPVDPEEPSESDDPREPSPIPAPVRCSRRDPKLPNISLHGPADTVGAERTAVVGPTTARAATAPVRRLSVRLP